MKTAIFYAGSTGNTQNAAEQILITLGGHERVDIYDISKCGVEKMRAYDKLIIGVSTWGEGELQDDWEEVFETFKSINFIGKTVAFFGLGDQQDYADEFLDAMGILYEVVSEKGGNVIGQWSTDGYTHDVSRAQIGGVFVGLALDEDNESDLTQERINRWCEQIKDFIL